MAARKKTRLSGPVLDPDIDFPLLDLKVFVNKKQLPVHRDVIGVLQYILEDQKSNVSQSDAIGEVKNRLYAKWYHDNVYCITQAGIQKRIEKDWLVFKEGKRRLQEGRQSGKAIDLYKSLHDRSNVLYDIAATSDERIQQCSEEFGVKMTSVGV